MGISYNINPKTRGVNGFGLPISDHVYAVKLDGSAEATVTVPSDIPNGVMGNIGSINPTGNVGQSPVGRSKWIAKFSYGTEVAGDVFVSVNSTATVPATNALVAQTAELKPTAYDVFSGDVIHMQCSTANTVVTVAFYYIWE